MPIYYCSISRGKVVVCDHTRVKLQVEGIALRALEQLGPSDTQRRQEINGNSIYTYVDNGLTYLCITDNLFPPNDAFVYLENVMKSFRGASLLSKAKSCGMYALRGDFEPTLARLTEEYSGDLSSSVKVQVHEIHDKMIDSTKKLMERGDRLDDLEERSVQLAKNSVDFKRSATKLRRNIVWKSFKLWIVLIVILLIIVAIVVVLVVLAVTHKL